MKLLIKHISEILDERLSLSMRGVLITILLLKENDPKLTLAKFKASTKSKEANIVLALLHKRGYIKWSGIKAYEKGLKRRETSPEIIEVYEFMNKLFGRGFKVTETSPGVVNLRERLNDYSVEDIKLVLANRYSEWKDDTEMHKHLTPFTIFRPSKFEKYYQEARSTKVGTSYLTVEVVGLKNGDEITSETAKSFVDNDTYNIVTYTTDSEGNRRENGLRGTRYGRDIKKTLKIQDNNLKFGTPREFIYVYRTN